VPDRVRPRQIIENELECLENESKFGLRPRLGSHPWGQACVLTYHEQGHSDILLPLSGFQHI